MNLVDEAFDDPEPQQALADLPGHQRTIARAWHVRALAQTALGDNEAATAGMDEFRRFVHTNETLVSIESPLDADAKQPISLHRRRRADEGRPMQRFADEITPRVQPHSHRMASSAFGQAIA